MGKIIVITSGKGGVGKTTVTASLGAVFAEAGYSVALVEGDIGLNNLDVALGLESDIRFDIVDVLMGRCLLREALISPPKYPNLKVLAGVHSDVGFSGGYEFKSICQMLAAENHFVLVDCPAGIEQSFYRAVHAAGDGIIVTTPHISAVRDADKTRNILGLYGINVLGVAVNRSRADLVHKGVSITPEELADIMHLPLMAALPEDDLIGMSGSLMLGASKASAMEYHKFASAIIRSVTPRRNAERG